MKEKKPSWIYYLVPIILGAIGGVASYLLILDIDKKFAKRLLIIGIIRDILLIIISILILIFPFFVIKTKPPFLS